MEQKSFPLQCKDIPDLSILQFLDKLGHRWATVFKGPDDKTLFENSIWNVIPAGTPNNLVRAKLKRLVSRGLIDACLCGCRGDLELTSKGKLALISG